jgi:hypothetical protein
MTLDLNSWETRLVLEALAALDQKWTAIIEDAASKGDEDTAAEYGNDALQFEHCAGAHRSRRPRRVRPDHKGLLTRANTRQQRPEKVSLAVASPKPPRPWPGAFEGLPGFSKSFGTVLHLRRARLRSKTSAII